MRTFADWLVFAKKWMVPVSAFGLLAIALVLRIFYHPEHAVSLLIIVAFIVLPLVFEVHQRVTETVKARAFRHFNDAAPQIRTRILDLARNQRLGSIRCLGVSLRNYWQFLESVMTELLNEKNPPRLVVEIAMLDPDWPDLDYLRAKDQRTHATANFQSIQALLIQHEEKLRANHWRIELSMYRYMPYRYGILLGDQTLFQGTMVWDERGNLTGGLSIVERFDAGDSMNGGEKISEFVGWFKHASKNVVLPSETSS